METEEKVNTKISLPVVLQKSESGVDVNKIEWEDELLRIDFVAKKPTHSKGMWCIRLCPEIFIRPVGSTVKLILVRSLGIPIAPLRFIFPYREFQKRFSLYFQLPPCDTKFMDIIERENAGGNFFNFSGVAISRVLSQQISIDGTRINPN
jgi:hypothetical protein